MKEMNGFQYVLQCEFNKLFRQISKQEKRENTRIKKKMGEIGRILRGIPEKPFNRKVLKLLWGN